MSTSTSVGIQGLSHHCTAYNPFSRSRWEEGSSLHEAEMLHSAILWLDDILYDETCFSSKSKRGMYQWRKLFQKIITSDVASVRGIWSALQVACIISTFAVTIRQPPLATILLIQDVRWVAVVNNRVQEQGSDDGRAALASSPVLYYQKVLWEAERRIESTMSSHAIWRDGERWTSSSCPIAEYGTPSSTSGPSVVGVAILAETADIMETWLNHTPLLPVWGAGGWVRFAGASV